MEVKASLRNLRIAPRKVRLVADLVRGKSVAEAKLQLAFNKKRASEPVLKLINSAVANADHNFNIDTETLRIKSIMVDQGPMLKRFMPRAFGRAAEIQKRMSHIRLVLEGQAGAAKAKTAVKNADAKAETHDHDHDHEGHDHGSDQPKPAKKSGKAKEGGVAQKKVASDGRRRVKRAEPKSQKKSS
jgi:large subunit ribosomal protein L22